MHQVRRKVRWALVGLPMVEGLSDLAPVQERAFEDLGVSGAVLALKG